MPKGLRNAGKALCLLLLSLALTGPVHAQRPRDDTLPPCRIGLALSGGAALGLAHIGVIKVLEQEKIPFCYVSGSSMGSIVGAMYACGYSSFQMESIARTTNWNRLFDDQVPYRALNLEEKEARTRYIISLPHRNLVPQLPSGAMTAENVYLYFKELTERVSFNARGDFDSLVVPYRAIAVDFVTGELITFDGGSVADAMRASMAIPGVFTPLYYNGLILLDGGVIQFLPVEPLLAFKPDFILAVDVRQPRDPKRVPSLVDLAWESFDIATKHDYQEQIGKANFVIHIDLKGMNASEFTRADEFIRRGEVAARAALPELKRALAGHRPISQRRKIPDRDMPLVRRIEIAGLRVTTGPTVRREVQTRTGDTLDINRLIQDIRAIHNTGLFAQVTYKLDPAPGDSLDILINVREKDYGVYSLGLRYDETNQFLFGAEAAQENLFGSGAGSGAGFVLGNPREGWLRYSGARFFGLPFNYRLQGFYSSADHRMQVGRSDGAWDSINYRQQGFGADLKLGVNIARIAYLKGGLELRDVHFQTLIGPAFDHDRERLAAVNAEFKTKTYSELSFPYQGLSLHLLAKYGLKPLSSEYGFLRAELRATAPVQLGRRGVFEPGVSAGLLLDGKLRATAPESLPVAERFRIGGPELAGMDFEEILTAQKITVNVGFKYLLLRLFNSADYPLYIELGGDLADMQPLPIAYRNVYYGGYAGATLSTPFGPVRVGYGVGKAGQRNFYFSAGYDLLHDFPR
jgi:NTE family protein